MIDEFKQALLASAECSLVVVTGAGISLASGIPTFRGNDPDAVWKKDVTELGTRRYFERDPVGSWRWYTERFDIVLDKQPNPAHHSLVDLENWQIARGGQFLLITQNIDGLHRVAGSERLVQVHGDAHAVRCSRYGCQNGAPTGSLRRDDIDLAAFNYEPSLATLPRCNRCGSLLRQHVLWFDEYYDEHESYQWRRVQAAASEMDIVLFVGTSFSVGVTDLFAQSGAQRGIHMFSIDPNHDAAAYPGLTLIKSPAETYLPTLMKSLA